MEQNTTTEVVEFDSIDDFLPMPGSESIATNDQEVKPGIFDKEVEQDLGFLDEETKEVNTVKAVLDSLDPSDDEGEEKTPTGRKRTDKDGLVEFLKKRIEAKEMFTFDDFDEKTQKLDDYLSSLSGKDIEDLWKANTDNLKNEVAEKTPKEFFESLPEELQYAAEYVAKGGTDMKGLFRVLAQVEETRQLDPSNEDHQTMIARQYLQATNYGKGDQDLIDEQIEEWVESGLIQKKAQQFKPKLDEMEEDIVKSKISQAEANKQIQMQKKEEYMKNIYNTLKQSELNGIKIDGKRQKFLWDELTTVKYESMNGRPTNLLGKLLEEHQFGKEPRYDLIAEATWLLSDPDDYRENVRKQAKNETIQNTVKKLKTEESRKLSSTVPEEQEEQVAKKIPKQPANIFKRQ